MAGYCSQQAIHFVDLLQWLVGGVERVDATTDTLVHGMDCEAVATVSLEFENGAYGTIEATTAVTGATRDGREPLVTGRDARTAMEIVLAGYESASSGRPIHVNDIRDGT